MGNRLVVVASEAFPLAATDFYQVAETSDVPAGVLNILTGPHAELAPHLAGHMDVDACGPSQSGFQPSRPKSSEGGPGIIKRTWVN